ncbi:MAG: PEGA domain-containing protein [Rhizobiales bacterium]|nr:PEGA domain-containing protein [Hyphomicrobiales bacterium]
MGLPVRIGAMLCACLLAGCATVTRGTSSQVQIQSEPAGADVRTSTGFTCTTPCTMTVGRKDEFSVTFTKAGYEPEQVDVKTRVAGEGAAAGIVGNVVIGGVVGMAADAASGATLEHTPNPLKVILYHKGKRPHGAGPNIVYPQGHAPAASAAPPA